MVTKIISGGQTGADQGGLLAAAELAIDTGGYAPRNWQTEDGPTPWLQGYGLTEHTGGYTQRTRANALDTEPCRIGDPRIPVLARVQ